jgi:protein phosphatase
MGSTLTACILLGGKSGSEAVQAMLVNQGDSVCFAIGKRITRLTKEHTLVSELVASGQITLDEAKVHPQRSVITHAMGMDPLPKPDIYKVEVKRQVQILLSTDGLLNHLSDEDIFSMVTSKKDVKSACEELVNEANLRGGADNISVILLRRDDYAKI